MTDGEDGEKLGYFLLHDFNPTIVQEALKYFENRLLELSLVHATQDQREYIFDILSPQAAELLKKKISALGEVDLELSLVCQLQFITLVRFIETEGVASWKSKVS